MSGRKIDKVQKTLLIRACHSERSEESRKITRKVDGILRRFAPQNDKIGGHLNKSNEKIDKVQKTLLIRACHSERSEESRKITRKVDGILRRFAPQNDKIGGHPNKSNEKILDALGNIDEKYLTNEEMPEKAGPRRTRKSRWRLGLAAGLAAALIALAILLLANAAPSRLALTVYAMGTDGSLTERPMPENLSLPVSLIEADDGTAGFLFSVPVDDPAATVGILPVGDASYDSGAVKTITSMSLAPGRAYYFLVGRAASEIQEATICHRKSASNIFLIHVTIEKTENGYLAKWEEVQKLEEEALEMPAAETDQA